MRALLACAMGYGFIHMMCESWACLIYTAFSSPITFLPR